MSKGKLRAFFFAAVMVLFSLVLPAITAQASTADDQDRIDESTAIADDGTTAIRGIVIPNG